MFRRLSIAALAAALALSGVACSSGGDDSDSRPTATNADPPDDTQAQSEPQTDDTSEASNDTSETLAPSPSDRVGCRAEVSGEVNSEFTGKDDGAAFSSDYYLSQEEIDQANDLFSDVGTDVASELDSDFTAGEEPDFTVPPRPEGAAPVVAWFLLNCQGGDISISFYSNGNATSDDVPFGPGQYVISPGGLFGDPDPEQFSALVSFGTSVETVWVADEGASITVERFDKKGAKGSFKVPMREAAIGDAGGDRQLLIEGTFDVTCKGGGNCDN